MNAHDSETILANLFAVQAQYACETIERATVGLERMITNRTLCAGATNTAAVVNLRDRGWKMREIAMQLRLSYGRVQQICAIELNRRSSAIEHCRRWK